MHIVELHAALMRAQGKEDELVKVRSYAASTRCGKDIQALSRIGMNTREIAKALSIHEYTVKHHEARLEEEEMRRRDFMLGCNLIPRKHRGGYLAILPRK